MAKLIIADIRAIAQPPVVRLAHEFDGWPPYRNTPPANDPDAQVPLAQIQRNAGTLATRGYPDPTFVSPLDRVVAMTGELVESGITNAAGTTSILVDTTKTFADVSVGDVVRNVTKGVNVVRVVDTTTFIITTEALGGGTLNWDLGDRYRVYRTVGAPNKVVEFARDRTERLRGVINVISRIATLISERFVAVDGTNAMANMLDLAGKAVESGTADAGGSSTTLIDASKDFTQTVVVGDVARNLTDGGNSVAVTDVAATTLTTEALAGGTLNVWTEDDSYTVSEKAQPINLGSPVDAGDLITKADLDVQIAAANAATTEGATVLQLDGSRTMTGDLVMGANKITNLEISEDDTDIAITRGSATFDAAGATVDVTIPAIGSLTSALLRITSTIMGGSNSSASVTKPSELLARAEIVDTTTLRFTRTAAPSNAVTIYWELWEYIGEAGGINEFIVRNADTVLFPAHLTGTADAGGSATLLVDAAGDFIVNGVQIGDQATNITDGSGPVTVTGVTATTLTTDALTGGGSNDWALDDSYETDRLIEYEQNEDYPPGIVDLEKLVPILMGLESGDTTTKQARCAFTVEAVLATRTVDIIRRASGSTAEVGYVLVEFTGSNWKTQVVTGTPTGDASEETLTTPVATWDESIILWSYAHDDLTPQQAHYFASMVTPIGALSQLATRAHGSVTIVSDPNDADKLTLTDAASNTVTFEFDSGGGVGTYNAPVTIATGDQRATAINFRDAVLGSIIRMTAVVEGTTVILTQTDFGAVGNTPITEDPVSVRIDTVSFVGGADVGAPPSTAKVQMYGTTSSSNIIAYVIENPGFKVAHGSAVVRILTGVAEANLPIEPIASMGRTGVISGLVDGITVSADPPAGYWSYELLSTSIVQYHSTYTATPRWIVVSWQIVEFPIKTTNAVSVSYLDAVRVLTEQSRFPVDGSGKFDSNFSLNGNRIAGVPNTAPEVARANQLLSKEAVIPMLDHFTDSGNPLHISSRIPIGAVLPYVSRSDLQHPDRVAQTDAFPSSYLLCDGSEQNVADYPKLAVLLNDTWGTPSSSLVFVLPDFRGRVLLGLDSGAGHISEDPFADDLAGSGGEGQHVLTEDEIAPHKHVKADQIAGVVSATGTITTSRSEPPTFRFLNADDAIARQTRDRRLEGRRPGLPGPVPDWGQPHDNVQPSIAIMYVVRAK